MEDRDANTGLRSFWEDVHKMPDKADAARQDCKQKQEVSEVDTPEKEQTGAPEVDRYPKESTAAGEDTEWILEEPPISEQECFEGDAEVVQASLKDATLHFEEEDTCVHPSKPDFDDEAGLDFDSASEGDPEASSLAGSDHEYAFVLHPPNMKLPEFEKEAPATPDKGRSMPQAPCSPQQSPSRWQASQSAQAMGPPSLPAARSGSEPPAQSPGLHSPAPPCTEGGMAGEGITGAEQKESPAAWPSHNAAEGSEHSPAGMITEHFETHSSTAKTCDQADLNRKQTILAQNTAEGSGSTADEATDESSLPHSPLGPPTVMPIEAGENSELPSSVQRVAAEVAAQRRRQLDAVGVIPGGRAAFGAKLPSHEVVQASSGARAAGGQQQQDARSARAALPELARPAAPEWARPRGRGSGSLGGGGSGPGTAAAMLLRRLQARPGPAALEGRRAPVPARRMEVRALPGAMLESYDSLWHGSSGIVASQS